MQKANHLWLLHCAVQSTDANGTRWPCLQQIRHNWAKFVTHFGTFCAILHAATPFSTSSADTKFGPRKTGYIENYKKGTLKKIWRFLWKLILNFSQETNICAGNHLVIVLSVDSAQCLVLSGKSLPFAISRGQLFTARKKVLLVRPKWKVCFCGYGLIHFKVAQLVKFQRDWGWFDSGLIWVLQSSEIS